MSKSKTKVKAASAGKTKTYVSRSPAEKAAFDKAVENELIGKLNETAYHSHSAWAFALKEFDRVGRGCLYWVFNSLEDAKKPGQPFPIEYRSEEGARRIEYEPVMKYIAQYVPQKSCVVLVGIRTGDRRDTLLKCILLERFTQDGVRAQRYPARLESLIFSSQNVHYQLPLGARFCSNPLCMKHEAKEDEHKRCQKCRFRNYCSRECQVIGWKSGHKSVCDEETKLIADWERRPRLIQGEAAEAGAGAGAAAGESGAAAASAGAGAGAGAGAAAESKGQSKPAAAAAAASAKAAESAGPTTAAQRLSGAALHEYMDAMARKELEALMSNILSGKEPPRVANYENEGKPFGRPDDKDEGPDEDEGEPSAESKGDGSGAATAKEVDLAVAGEAEAEAAVAAAASAKTESKAAGAADSKSAAATASSAKAEAPKAAAAVTSAGAGAGAGGSKPEPKQGKGKRKGKR